MIKHATIRVPGLKVAVPLPADAIPQDLVPMEGPAGEPVLELVLEGGLPDRTREAQRQELSKDAQEYRRAGRGQRRRGPARGSAPADRPGRRSFCSRVPASRSPGGLARANRHRPEACPHHLAAKRFLWSKPCGAATGLPEHRLEVQLRGLQSIMIRPITLL